jgi:hypothetical protein
MRGRGDGANMDNRLNESAGVAASALCWYPRPASSFLEDTQKLGRSVTGKEPPDEPRRRGMTGQEQAGGAQVQEEALSPPWHSRATGSDEW